MFLAQALNTDRSCQKIVNDTAIKLIVGGLSPCSRNTSGYCQARQRLPLAMVSTLARYTGELMNQHIPSDWRWQRNVDLFFRLQSYSFTHGVACPPFGCTAKIADFQAHGAAMDSVEPTNTGERYSNRRKGQRVRLAQLRFPILIIQKRKPDPVSVSLFLRVAPAKLRVWLG